MPPKPTATNDSLWPEAAWVVSGRCPSLHLDESLDRPLQGVSSPGIAELLFAGADVRMGPTHPPSGRALLDGQKVRLSEQTAD